MDATKKHKESQKVLRWGRTPDRLQHREIQTWLL